MDSDDMILPVPEQILGFDVIDAADLDEAVVAALIALTGDRDRAEECTQEASAGRHCAGPTTGFPDVLEPG